MGCFVSAARAQWTEWLTWPGDNGLRSWKLNGHGSEARVVRVNADIAKHDGQS